VSINNDKATYLLVKEFVPFFLQYIILDALDVAGGGKRTHSLCLMIIA